MPPDSTCTRAEERAAQKEQRPGEQAGTKAAPDAAGVLPCFTGTMVHDRLALYFSYEGAADGLCGAHLVRNLASVAQRPSQAWAEQVRRLLLETNTACHLAREKGRRRLPANELEAFLSSYEKLVEAGLAANRPLRSRARNSLERESHNLVVALRDRRVEVTRFACDFAVPFTNNEAERSLRMAKLSVYRPSRAGLLLAA